MVDPYDKTNTKLLKRWKRQRAKGRLVLLAESLLVHFWRLISWVLLFAGLWLLGLPFLQNSWIGTLVLALFGLGAGYFLYKDVLHIGWPKTGAVDRRLEVDNNLPHRPLTMLEDELANAEAPATMELWLRGKTHMLLALHTLKAPRMRNILTEHDPYGLRFMAVLFLLIGAIAAGPDWQNRLKAGLTALPFSEHGAINTVSLWITPPDYTGFAPLLVEGAYGKILEIPRGSQMKLRIESRFGTPALYYDDTKTPLDHLGGDSYGIEMAVPDAETLEIKQPLRTRAKWDIVLLPDLPPSISVREDPTEMQNTQLRFPLSVHDDYGVRDLTLRMDLDPVVAEAPLGSPYQELRSVISPAGQDYAFEPVYDLTAHTWAGLPVIIDFSVSDHQDQTGHATPIKMVLPERVFRHPVAKKLIELRKRLAWEQQSATKEVSVELSQLLKIPSAFHDDKVAYLAIRVSSSRLRYDSSIPAIEEVIALLWDTALRIEDGNLSIAARNLRDARQALEKKLADPNAREEEIAEAMQDLREAMQEYMMEFQKELQKQLAEGKQMMMVPPEMLSQTFDPQALQNFMEQMEREFLNGNRNAAQQMLSQLQRMMDMLDPSMTMAMPMDMQMMMQGINELQELIDRQQDLLDQTKVQQSRQELLQNAPKAPNNPPLPDSELLREWVLNDLPMPEAQGDIDTSTNKTEQESLRLVLGQLMLETSEKLGEIPENMGLAEQDMRGSSGALGQNDPGGSIPYQEAALKHLKEAMEQMSEQMMQRMAAMSGMGFSGAQFDPLGRPYEGNEDPGGLFPGARVKIPDEAERRRVDEILKELRQRSGERDRPDVELEYYRRLLRQF